MHPTVKVRVDLLGDDLVQHTILRFTDARGRVIEYGLAPDAMHALPTAPDAEDIRHSAEGPTWVLTEAQYRRLVSEIQRSLANTPCPLA
ncbi:hypothetical protein [Herbaspirillum sp. alder98]|uniref:hypothetical protein n=1 Tax=Herbaspirillum sp. alder98 TaxID=2913096 RepID=UPI001CD8507E|nr:hypothetical protein [Herbaspirillum sp. alder98]MCA1326531.1 hypothetical protein [Herbaspirillum sp. alder98]